MVIASMRYPGLGVPIGLKYHAAANAAWTLKNGGGSEGNDPYTGLDRFGRLIETIWQKPDTPDPVKLVHTTYGRNCFGGVTWKRDVLAHAGSVTTEDYFYWYDGLQQNYRHERGNLTPSTPPYTGIDPTTRQQLEIRSFDETGNWLRDFASATSLNQTRTHNKANEITDLSGPGGVVDPVYDDGNAGPGNMTTMPGASPDAWGTSCALTWDAWNRPVTFNDGSANSCQYDALHRRIIKTIPGETRDYYFDNQWRAVEERDGGNVQAHYVWSPTDRWTLIRRKRTVTTPLDETLFVLKDYLDPAAVINTSAVVQERFSYDAFGPVRFLNAAFGSPSSSSALAWNFLFHAEFRDIESGLYNYGFRYYHPYLGRWISRDPIGEDGGLNLYGFLGNDSPNHSDFLGNAPTGRPDPVRPGILGGCGSLRAHLRVLIQNLKLIGSIPSVYPYYEPNPFQHCVWNCRMTRAKGRKYSEQKSWEKEKKDAEMARLRDDMINSGCYDSLTRSEKDWIDGHAESAMQPSDFRDNRTGRDCGEALGPMSTLIRQLTKNNDCECCCRSKGITEDTKEGPGTERPYGPYAEKGASNNMSTFPKMTPPHLR